MNEIKELDVSILVNNVGVDVLAPYHTLTEQQINNLVIVNCTTTALMNRIFIPMFMERGRRGGRSAIVNVASLAGIISSYFRRNTNAFS
jgi:17beta-estradiol 17-dehydrogenase / very-long-chain 3-oxoacyl-CoA reductase